MEAMAERERRAKRLGLYTTAAAGAIFASGGQAAITASPNATDSFTVDGFEEVPFDIDGDGSDDISFSIGAFDCDSQRPNSPGAGSVRGINGAEVSAVGSEYGGDYAALVSGSFAGENLTSGTAELFGCSGDTPEMPFTFDEAGSSNSGFIGVQFQRGEGEGSTTHNGVVALQFGTGSVVSNIVAACYGSEPGEPVSAGECSSVFGMGPTAVPTGRLAVPLSLGLLALGALALHRRQRAHA